MHGSYWNGQIPTANPWNNFWHFGTLTNGVAGYWAGTVHIDSVITNANNVDVQNCGSITTNFTGGGGNTGITANAIINVDGQLRNIRIQQDAALGKLQTDNLGEAIALFEPVAWISKNVRDTANAAVRYFIDVAKVMVMGEGSVAMRSKSNNWLPETLVEMPQKPKEKVSVFFPNPANDMVQMTIKTGNYHLRVSNAIGQTIFAQNTEGVLSVNVAAWTNGIYLFELTDKATNKRQRNKIVVQH